MNKKSRFNKPIIKKKKDNLYDPVEIDFASIAKSSIVGISVSDKKMKFIYVNDAKAKMFGYKSSKELTGKSWRIIYEEEELKRYEEEIIPELYDNGFWQGEVEGRKLDGNKFYMEVSLSLTINNRIVKVVRDISERKNIEKALEESELKYRSLIDNLHEGVFYVDNNAVMMYANKRTCEIFGYSLNELIGKSSFKLLYEQNDIEFLLKKNKLREQGISDAYELKCKKKNGELIWCYISGTPYYNIKGNIIGSITIITDITEQKLSDEALKESEIKFQIIFMLSVDAIGVSKYGVNLLVNPAFLN
ncbi:MAG: PAS domain-containing protein, partial [Ignavibacteriae bacterium]|nr:PAS domain-containing protein [Ignavibacteriota bacterium]